MVTLFVKGAGAVGMVKMYVSLRCFDAIPERDGRTDRQTDRIAISISRVSIAVLTR